MAKKEEYDWLNDPFDEKKSAKEQEEARMSTGAKIGLGCLVVLLVLIVIAVFAVGSISFLALDF